MVKILTKKEIKELIKHLHEIYEANPHSRVRVDIHVLARIPNSELKCRTIFWVRAKKYKIKRKTKMTFTLSPPTYPKPTPFETMCRTPVMYKHNG